VEEEEEEESASVCGRGECRGEAAGRGLPDGRGDGRGEALGEETVFAVSESVSVCGRVIASASIVAAFALLRLCCSLSAVEKEGGGDADGAKGGAVGWKPDCIR
jgi:hypothetical protein